MARRFALDYMEEQSAAGADYAWRIFVVGYATPIVAAVVQYPRREAPVGWWYVVAAVLSWTTGIGLGLYEERKANRSAHTTSSSPATTMLIALSIAVSIFCVEMALCPRDATMRWLLLIPVFLIATVGNRLMLAITIALSGFAFALASADTAATATTSWAGDLVIAAMLVLVFRIFAGRVIRSFARDTLFGSMSEVTATADSLTDGWARVLPLAARYLDGDTIAILEADGPNWHALASWPEGTVVDLTGDGVVRMITEVAAGAPPVRDGSLTAIGVVVDDHSIVAFATGTDTMLVDGMYQLFRSHQVGVQLRVLVSRMRSIEALAEQGRTDSLTGLPNRRSLMAGLADAMTTAGPSDHPLCAVMIDLDHFKDFNDRFGHLEGDHALTQVASLMASRSRSSDIVCRFGGEEFALVLPRTALVDAQKLVDDLRPCVRDLPLQDPLSISAGVAQWDGAEGPEALLRRADQALYRAKATGRDRVLLA